MSLAPGVVCSGELRLGAMEDWAEEVEAAPARDVVTVHLPGVAGRVRRVPTDWLLQVGRALFVAGWLVGWSFSSELLDRLLESWRRPTTIWEVSRSSAAVLWWRLNVSSTAGVLLALPVATLLVWSWRRPRSYSAELPSVVGFIIASYVSTGLGLGLVGAAFPALVAHVRSTYEVAPEPWCFIEPVLQGVLDIALVAQLSVVLIRRARTHV